MTIVIAHRGGGGPHLENTLEAFEVARGQGAHMVELDCRLTRDKTVVAFHDRKLKRAWGINGDVGHLDWAQVAQARWRGYRIPSLSEVLAHVDLPVMLDMPGAEVAEASLALVRATGDLERCLFAGRAPTLDRARTLCASARFALSWEKREPPSAQLLERVKPEYYNPQWRLARREVVARMHQAGVKVSVWTVNQPWAMRMVLGHGVDAVISDNVPRLRDEITRRGSNA